MDKGTIDFTAFRRELDNLCERYHVLKKKETVRRENLSGLVQFYDVELSLKLNQHIGDGWIIE